MEYQETGNKIPINAHELTDYVKQQLASHDAFVSGNKTLPEFNPYTHPIIYKTKDGKTIMIPDEIQKQAISQWYQEHGTNVPVAQYLPQETTQVVKLPQGKPKIEYVDDDNGDYMRLGLLIFTVFVALYLFYKWGHNTSPSSGSGMSYDQIRAYMMR